MTKLNPQTMKNQYDHQYVTFCRKNHDYGNSFEESLDQFGIVASIVRMSDKMKRLESLTDESKTQQVGSESLIDTLEDLSNYAAMTACWLKGIREEDDENTICADNKPVMTFSEKIPMSQFNFLHREHEIVAMLEKVLEFNYKIEWNRMTEDECVELKEIMNRLGNMVTEGSISEELMLDLINNHVKFNPESTINRLFNQIKESQKNPNEDMDIEFVSLLKLVEKFHHKIEEFKMTEADHKELEEIINRLRSIIQDAPISKEGIVSLIKKHVLLNPDVLIFQLYNPVREISKNTFLDIAKSTLNDLFDNIILCRDQNIPLPKRLTYCSYREEKYEHIAALVLTGNIDYSDVARIVNDYPNLRVAEKNHLLQSIVSAAYKISDEPENEKPEFLNKKFHIPDEILKDLKEPEEEPERKRTVLEMIFPFRL